MCEVDSIVERTSKFGIETGRADKERRIMYLWSREISLKLMETTSAGQLKTLRLNMGHEQDVRENL